MARFTALAMEYLHVSTAFFLVTFLAQHSSVQSDITPVLEIRDGPIFGSVKSINGQPYEEYLGIPFAAPPIGPLRFEKPAPLTPWVDTLNCTQYSQHCTDFLANFYPLIGLGGKNGEDCLYVNVWVPQGVQANAGRKLPVMVFVYGGGFNIGTGEMYPGNALAVHGDMIVVNFNYRVGIFGFLSTGDDVIPGNYGLWDQKAALDWIQENIVSFNGDPSRVTIFGQSAGGVSVSHLMISPKTEGLFQSVIAVSGAASANWGTSDRALEGAVNVAQLLNCSAKSSVEILDCFRKIDARELDYWSSIGMSIATGEGSGFQPVVDGDFVPRPPRQSFEMGIGSEINFMTGSAYHDAAGFVFGNPIALPAMGDKANSAATNASMWRTALGMLHDAQNAEELLLEIISMYPDLNTEDTLTRTLAFTKVCTDGMFGSYSNWEAVRHASAGGSGRTYQYVFQYRQSFLYGYPEWVNGSHLDDIYSFLGEPFMEDYRNVYLKQGYDDLDQQVRDSIMDYYTNFAHTGDPNSGPKTPVLHWKDFTGAEQNYLQQSNTFRMSSFYEHNQVDLYRFWTDVLPDLIVPYPPPTFEPSTGENRLPAWSRFSEKDITAALNTLKIKYKRLVPLEEAWKKIDELLDNFASQL